MGSKSAIYRRFLLATLWHAIGRVAEAVFSSWSLTRWDYTLGMLFFNWSQIKTAKQKGVIMPCDKDGWECDFYHCLASYFVMGFGQNLIEPDGIDWIFPDLHSLTGSGITKRVATYLRDCLPGMGAKEFESIRVFSLPFDITGRSLRSGSINNCKAMGATHEHISLISGHEMTMFSSLFEYYLVTEYDAVHGMLLF